MITLVISQPSLRQQETIKLYIHFSRPKLTQTDSSHVIHLSCRVNAEGYENEAEYCPESK